MRRLTFVVVTAILASLASTSLANADMGPWIAAEAIKFRLVATARGVGETPVAALELVLDPGWKSYWRTPGEGGLPPILDFDNSSNLAAVSVGFPAPRRHNDGYTVTNIYEGRWILPIELTPEQVSSPMTVNLRMQLGVCELICFPLEIEASVTFSPNVVDHAALALFDEGTALLPSAPLPGEFEISSLDLIAITGEAARFEAVVIVPQAFGAELFVEGPAAWLPPAPQQIARDGNRLTFSFAFHRLDPAVSPSGTVLTFTLVSSGDAIEQRIVLP